MGLRTCSRRLEWNTKAGKYHCRLVCCPQLFTAQEAFDMNFECLRKRDRTVNLTREQLLAGARSMMAEILMDDPYMKDTEGFSVIEPDDKGGWRIQEGEGRDSLWHIEESKVLQRAAVLVVLGTEPV